MTERVAQYAGADWIKADLKITEMSKLGENVADLLGDVYAGIYHLETPALRRVDWKDPYSIRFILSHHELATFDYGHLTMLVVLGHDRMIRVAISAVAPKRLELRFHARESRDGSTMSRMPTMEDHIFAIRRHCAREGS